jgi:hypothetical protein
VQDIAGDPLSMALVGVVSAGVYVAWWTRPAWLFNVSLHERAHSLPDFVGGSAEGCIFYTQGFVLAFVLYSLALFAASKAWSRSTVVIGMAGAIGLPLTLLLAYPSLAADIFGYMVSARIWVAHGANPYVTAASSFPRDVYVPAVPWPDQPAPYGPLFVLITAAPVRLAGGNPTAALIAIKAITIAAHAGTAGLIYLIVRRLAPERAVLALVAYGWNPLAVIYFGMDGHNDAIMLFFLAAAIYAAVRERHDVALPLLALSVLVKYATVLLFPVFLYAALRDRRQLVTGAAVSILLVVAAYWPFWAGRETFDGTRQTASQFTSSPSSLLRWLLPSSVVRGLMTAVFALGYVATFIYAKRLVNRSLAIMVLYLLTVSFWLKEWYLTWPLAIAAIAGGWPLAVAALWTLGPFLLNIFNGWGWSMNWWHWQQRWGLWMMDLWLTTSLLAPFVAGLIADVAVTMAHRRQSTGANLSVAPVRTSAADSERNR